MSMTASINRRQALAGIGIASATGMLPMAAATVAQARSADCAAWHRAFAKMEQASRQADETSRAYDVAYEAWSKDRPSMDCIHWKEFAFRDRNHVARVMDVEEEFASFLQSEGKLWWAKDREATIARVRTAYDSVLKFRRREQEHDDRTGQSAAAERADEAADALSHAQGALMRMPAPDRTALHWKLQHLLEVDHDSTAGWSADYVEQTKADMRRLLAS
jgi:hypothetical protein